MGLVRKLGNWATSPVRQDPFLLVLLTALVVVRLFYLQSYPFLVEGDGRTYYDLLQDFRSNLLHATGYVFFSSIPNLLANLVVSEPASLLGYWQQLFCGAGAVILYLALRRIIHRWLALLVCSAIGIDAQLVMAAGTTRPEFFQATLLMFLVSVAILGLTAESATNKTILYVTSGALMAAGFLTKYNFLPAVVFCVVPLLDRKLHWRSRFRILSYSAIGAVGLWAAFLASFHYPSTGSLRLNLEHGWIQILKLEAAQIPLVATNGIATQKYIILAENLPRVPAGAGIWNSLNEIPEDVRAPFRERWLSLLDNEDRSYVQSTFDALFERGGLKGGYYDPGTLCSIYHHLGLQEGEALLGEVFREGIRTHSTPFAVHVWKSFLTSTNFSAQYVPYLPVPKVYEPPLFFENSKTSFFAPRAGFIKAGNWSDVPPELATHIWYPGARFFSYLAFLKVLPTTVVWVIILAGFLPFGLSVVRTGQIPTRELLFLLSFFVLLGEMAFSALILQFRMKELILCQPLIFTLLGLSAALWTAWLGSGVTISPFKNVAPSALTRGPK